MNDDPLFNDELLDLADIVCDGAPLTDADSARLESMLQGNPAAQRLYLKHICLDTLVRWEFASGAKEPIAPLAEPPVIVHPGNPVVYGTLGQYMTGWPAAYLIAAVICAVGLTLAAFTYVSQPTDIAQLPNNSNPQSLIPNPSPIVARITGTSDCLWERKGGVASGQWPVASDGLQNEKCKLQNANCKLDNAHFPNSSPQPLAPSPSSNPQIPKSLVCLGDQFILSAGLMEITYNTGARVILQGPCTYEVDSAAGGFLEVGKLTARVEQSAKYGVRSTEQVASGKWRVTSDGMQNEKCKLQNAKLGVASESSLTTNHYPLTTISNPQSLIPNPLFCVRTPTATVTDLGTEFGVEVDGNGNTASHVFQGSVQVQAIDADGRMQPESRILYQNESARVERRGDASAVVVDRTLAPLLLHAFVRDLPKPTIKVLDLADVVAGGDGFSGRRGRGIDPATGLPTDSTLAEPKNTDANDYGRFRIESDGKYHRVESIPLIDGVFIPNSRPGGVQVDSAGHRFSEYEVKCDTAAGHVWSGGAVSVLTCSMPANVAALLPAISPTHTLVPTNLDSVDYASEPHGLIFMPANNGITFDLDAIRRANPGFTPMRLLATAGNTEIASEHGLAEVYADLRVLVDGRVRFQRRQINKYSGAFPIALSIGEGDRFLTLLATDGGNDIGFDWILLGNPILELYASAPEGQGNPPPKRPGEKRR